MPAATARVAYVAMRSSASVASRATDGERLEHLLDERQLRAELVRRRRPGPLVVGEDREPLGGPAAVEGDDDALGAVVGEQLDEHAREPVDGVRELPRRGPEVVRQRVVGAEGEAVAVEEGEDGARGHGPDPTGRPHG
jgi:hypothetical protein